MPRLKELIRVDGGRNGSQPVTGLSLIGLEFRDAAPTYLEPHGMPSGGVRPVNPKVVVLFRGNF